MEDGKQRSWIEDLCAPEIFRAFRLAVHPRKMILALAAVALLCGVGSLMDLTRTVVVDPASGMTELHRYAEAPKDLPRFVAEVGPETPRIGVFAALFSFGSGRFHRTLYSWFRIEELQTVALPETVSLLRDAVASLSWAFRYHLVYSLCFFSLALLVLTLAGGAIARMAALQLGPDERPGLVECLRFSLRRITSLLAAFAVPLAVVAVFGAGVVVLGLIGNIPVVGELAVALAMPLSLITGVVMVFFLVGVGAGSGLLCPAVAYEDGDAFTAVNNAFRYVYVQPWRLGLHSFVAAAYGAITYLFVRFFAFATLLVTYRCLEIGFLRGNAKLATIWAEPTFVNMVTLPAGAEGGVALRIGEFLIHLCALTVAGIVGSYLFSYYYTVSTIIYALLRRHVDRVPLHRVRSASADA